MERSSSCALWCSHPAMSQHLKTAWIASAENHNARFRPHTCAKRCVKLGYTRPTEQSALQEGKTTNCFSCQAIRRFCANIAPPLSSGQRQHDPDRLNWNPSRFTPFVGTLLLYQRCQHHIHLDCNLRPGLADALSLVRQLRDFSNLL